MIRVLWEFIVKEEAVDRFERAYGPGGEWARLFARYAGYRGTMLLRDGTHPRRYQTLDAWDTRDDRDRMLRDAAAEYAALDAAFEGWTESETEIGVFEVV